MTWLFVNVFFFSKKKKKSREAALIDLTKRRTCFTSSLYEVKDSVYICHLFVSIGLCNSTNKVNERKKKLVC